MATTVTYKGATLTTVDNNTRTLKTAGTYLEDDITLVDVSGGVDGDNLAYGGAFVGSALVGTATAM